VAAAALAPEAPLERLFDFLALPAGRDELAAQHFGEQARAAAGRVALFARAAVTRAHGAALGRAALPHPNAVPHRAHEAVSLGRNERKFRGKRDRPVLGPQAQMLIDPERVDDLPRIHPFREIPRGLELAKRLHQLLAEHERQELRARVTVAVLAGER